MSRPKIAIAARRADKTSASRRSALISSERLAAAIWEAVGDPVIMYPAEQNDFADRLSGISGVLIPGGGDVDPSFYGQEPASAAIYGVDKLVDSFDLELSDYALKNGIPLLAICRGAQIINVLRGGTLVQDLEHPHTNLMHKITVFKDHAELGLGQAEVECSCYHHQAVDQLGSGLEVIARSDDGLVEAMKVAAPAWAYAVQWHPEDNWQENDDQLGIFRQLVHQAAGF